MIGTGLFLGLAATFYTLYLGLAAFAITLLALLAATLRIRARSRGGRRSIRSSG